MNPTSTALVQFSHFLYLKPILHFIFKWHEPNVT